MVQMRKTKDNLLTHYSKRTDLKASCKHSENGHVLISEVCFMLKPCNLSWQLHALGVSERVQKG